MSTDSIDGFTRIGERVARAIADHPADNIPRHSDKGQHAPTDEPKPSAYEEPASPPVSAQSNKDEAAASQRSAIQTLLILACVIGFVLLLVSLNKEPQEEPASQVEATAPAPAPSVTTPAYQQQATNSSKPWEDVAVIDEFKEVTPINPGQTYSQDELRYCRFEAMRLEHIRRLIDESSDYQVGQFNTGIERYNSLCGNYRYHERDLNAVNSQVARRTSVLLEEARARFAHWKRLENSAVGRAYAYTAGSQPAPGNFDPATAQPTRTPRLSSCQGMTMVINFYSEDDRLEAARVAQFASGAGVFVKEVENVVASAEARGSKSPYRWKQPAVIMHEPIFQSECAAAFLASSGLANGVARPLPKNFTGTPGMMEIWLAAPAGTLAGSR